MSEQAGDIGNPDLPVLSERVAFGPSEYIEGRVKCLVKNRVTEQYFRSGLREIFILQHLDGKHTATELAQAYQKRFGTDLSSGLLQGLLTSASHNGLLQNGTTTETTVASLSGNAPMLRLFSPFSFKLLKWDPDEFLSRFSSKFRWLVSAPSLAIWLLIIIATELIVAGSLGDIWRSTADSGMGMIPLRALSLVAIYSIMMMIHEGGHAIACKAYGGSVREMGFMVKYLIPGAYTKIDDILMFRGRLDRICTILIGPVVSLTMIPVALCTWKWTPQGSLEHVIAADILIWYNLNSVIQFIPFLKLDGYFMLAQMLRMPDLMADSYRYLLGVCAPASAKIQPMQISAECPAYVKPVLLIYGCLSVITAIACVTFAIHMYAGALLLWLGAAAGAVVVVLLIGMLFAIFVWRALQWNRSRHA
jgi:putative peptide zinc metalloprotease protein